MDKDLKKQLKRLALKHRPRPLMGPFYDHKTGLKYYIRKRDLSYFELRKKYPPKPLELKPPRHVFMKKHHLAHKPEYEPIYGYIIAACGISLAALIAITYIVLFIRASL